MTRINTTARYSQNRLTAALKGRGEAPMAQAELYARALANATEVVGGIDELSRRLEVSEAVVRAWLERPGSMPEAAFLKVTEILTEASLQMLNERRVMPAGAPPPKG